MPIKIQSVNIDSLTVNPSNPRVIKDDKYKKLVQSIKDFPKMLEIRPIVVNADMMVLGGNMRLRACKDAGLNEVPVIRAEDLTDDEQKEFIIKDNVGFGEWDWDMIANEWDAELIKEWGLDIPDFILHKDVQEDDYEMPDEIQTDIVLGDLFEIGEHRLLCGDSTNADDVAKLMNGQRADMVFTDPPYNALKSWKKDEARGETRLDPSKWFANDNMEWDEYELFLGKVFKGFSGHSVYACCDYRIYPIISFLIKETPYELKHCIVWKKNVWGLGKRYRFQHEFIVYACKPKAPFIGDRSQSDVWEIDTDKTKDHNTPKPVKLPGRAINNTCNVDDIIQDLFLGSGTTMVAAQQLGRKCYGMEIDPKYCQVIIDRMLKLCPELEIKRNGEVYEPQAINIEQ